MASITPMKAPRPALWRDPLVRSVFYQVVALAVVVAVGGYLVNNTIENLARLGVTTGFGFLTRQAGFGISQSMIAYNETWSFGRAFLVGLVNTVYAALIGIVLATLIGFLVGIARLSRNWIVSHLAAVYVEVVRNVPVLLQLLLVYTIVVNALPSPADSISFFGLARLNNRGLFVPRAILGDGSALWLATAALALVAAVAISRWARRRRELTGQGFPTITVCVAILVGVPALAFVALGSPLTFEIPVAGKFRTQGGLTMLPELVALVVGLSVYTASYIAEIVRSGILAVSKGQTEAAAALGLPPGKVLRLVVVPQAMRLIIPPLASQYLNLTKNSSLGIAIGYPDFFSIAGTVNNQTGQAVEVIAITMAVYLALSLITSAFMNWYNARIALVER